MTDEQINAAIAEAYGWKQKRNTWLTPNGIQVFVTDVPNYCNDLNAMHEVEKTIFPHYASVYSNKLAKVTGAEMSDDTDYFCATARQRAEAFLRTLGKWEEATNKDSLSVQKATTEQSSGDHFRDATKKIEEVQG